MTVTLQGYHPELIPLIQQNTLQRTFLESLQQRLLFRNEVVAERWDANAGDSKVFTRAGKLAVNVKPLPVGQDPTPKAYATEQFRVEAAQYADRIQTHLPTARAAIQGKFLKDTQALGVNAGETLNRLTRDKLYIAYLSGDTVTISAAGSSASQLQLASLNGFAERVTNGQLGLVSPSTPIAVELGATNLPNTVIAVQPADPTEPTGPGTITLGTPLAAPLAARSRVKTLQRARVVRAGGAATVDNITPSTFLTMDAVIQAVQLLRGQNVPPHADGRYHVHIPVDGVTQLFKDQDFKELHKGNPPSQGMYSDLEIANMLGCVFYQNQETPNQLNSGVLIATGNNARAAAEVGAEVVNENAVPIARTIVTGGGVLSEQWIPETEYGTEAGYAGKVSTFSVTAAGIVIPTDRVRYILRQPQDVLQQVVDQAWSWSGDFAAPSDLLSGNGSRFKRACVIEHAGV